ncbi:hypothetical protein ACFHYQ_00425 [Sphaerimonospora cavernae]|uniref:Uncharacterized protein n=1 Tax=Sphaerimonospora cavernae TaxID=1740611 RepID=A0ABV6TX30_9ACTN
MSGWESHSETLSILADADEVAAIEEGLANAARERSSPPKK